MSHLSFAKLRNGEPLYTPKTRLNAARDQREDGSSACPNGALTHCSSIVTTGSSRPRTTDVPWCECCLHINRRLRDHLHEVLDAGYRTIDEWTCVADASPDHMGYEPTTTVAVHVREGKCIHICKCCIMNATLGTERQGYIDAASSPTSSTGWSGGTLDGTASTDDHVCASPAAKDLEMSRVASLETLLSHWTPLTALLPQCADSGRPSVRAPLDTDWASENIQRQPKIS